MNTFWLKKRTLTGVMVPYKVRKNLFTVGIELRTCAREQKINITNNKY